MRIFAHFALPGFTNSYLIGPDGGGDAVLVDPGVMDTSLLRIIEDNRYTVRHILVTHSHDNHIHGIQTLLKIYHATVYSRNPRLYTVDCVPIQHNQTLVLGDIEVHCLSLPGHSSDSMVYTIENMIFSGDSLMAGQMGSAGNSYGRANLLENIRSELLNQDPGLLVFPGHGPPTTLEAETLFNMDLNPETKET